MTYIRVTDMLKIGVGPSSSHTLGPWKAAARFLEEISRISIPTGSRLQITLYGSLALTGKGHATDKAVTLGLLKHHPESIDTAEIAGILRDIHQHGKITTNKNIEVLFDPQKDIHFHKSEFLPFHPNALSFVLKKDSSVIVTETYFSIGGGFVVKEGEQTIPNAIQALYPCHNATDLLKHCTEQACKISDLVWKNELQFCDESTLRTQMLGLWNVMKESAYTGCHTEGILPGGLLVKRRAAQMNRQLIRRHDYQNANEWLEAMKEGRDFRKVLTRISCIAIAVNEVNADMGRIVTAPTNGSAGVIPAVLIYYYCFSGQEPSEDDIIRFLLTAAEIGKYFKLGATISAAAGGCQAEIGVSSSMAAAALTECLGGTPAQVLMAAEIAAEHHLGMTCDPIGGLVQIPCIERNSMGAIKAVTAAMIALESDPLHARVSLDNVIKTMKETAENMNSRFKETSLGGLAINVPVNIAEC